MKPGPQPRSSLSSDVSALRGIIDAVPHPIFVKDDHTRYVIMNETMCTLMGRSFDELVGNCDSDFFPATQAKVFRGNDLRVLSTGETNENEELFTDGDGNLRTIVTRKKRLVLPDGSRLLVGCITDISDFRRAEALIRHHAEHDPLTGLANRRIFSEEVEKALARVNRSAANYAILLLDLDRFKPINDNFGHTTGDVVLCEIATRLKRAVRKGDTVARFGGDEFAIVSESFPGSESSAEAAKRLATRLIGAVRQPVSTDHGALSVGISIGIAQCPEDGADPVRLLRCADAAMYRAKQEGRGGFRFFGQIEQPPSEPLGRNGLAAASSHAS